jgi:ABC-type transport system involved in multi-copper enzyme maturation permease subunit
MTFLPIVERELRVASRRRTTFWMRAGVAGAVILAGVAIFLSSLGDSPTDLGQHLFYFLTGGAFLHALFLGVRSTADCLSEEKREGTLGLLFLTDLKGYDVVFGKLVATSINGFYGLLAAVPVMAIPLLLGGVAHAEFWRVALVLTNTLFFSLTVGIFISATNRSARTAMAGTLLLILFITVGLPLCGLWAAVASKIPNIEMYFVLPSPGCALALAYETPMRKGVTNGFWISTGIVHGLAWVSLVLASLITPRSWQDKPASATQFRWLEWWRARIYGASAERREFRKRLLDRNAFFWLAARQRLQPAWVWAVLGVLAGLWLWGMLKFRHDWFNEGVYIATALVGNSVLKAWLASEATRTLAENRRLGALELLLSTPLSVREILRGQMLALRRQFLWPVAAVLLVEVSFLLAIMRDTNLQNESRVWATVWIIGMTVLVADLIALYWVGMWMGLAARNINRASGGAVMRIMVLPWAAWGIISGLIGLATMRGADGPGGEFYLWLWFGLAIAADVVFGFWSRHKLYTHFRALAAQRYMARESLWKRLFSGSSAVETDVPAAVPSP